MASRFTFVSAARFRANIPAELCDRRQGIFTRDHAVGSRRHAYSAAGVANTGRKSYVYQFERHLSELYLVDGLVRKGGIFFFLAAGSQIAILSLNNGCIWIRLRRNPSLSWS